MLENPDAEQVAARIPFSGTLEDPETNLFATIASVMRNAFVSAFARSLEGSITLRDVKKNVRGIAREGQGGEGDKEKKDGTEKEERAKPKPGPAGKT